MFITRIITGSSQNLWSAPEISLGAFRCVQHTAIPLTGYDMTIFKILTVHDDIKWKHFPRYCPFVRGNHRWPLVPLAKASDAELWCFLWFAPELTIEQTIESPVTWDTMALIMTTLKGKVGHSWKWYPDALSISHVAATRLTVGRWPYF